MAHGSGQESSITVHDSHAGNGSYWVEADCSMRGHGGWFWWRFPILIRTIVDPILSCLQLWLLESQSPSINKYELVDVGLLIFIWRKSNHTEIPTPRMTQEAHVSPGCARASSKQRGTKIPRFQMAHNSGAIGTCGSRSELNLKLCKLLWSALRRLFIRVNCTFLRGTLQKKSSYIDVHSQFGG